MRLWHKTLVSVLPRQQLLGQWRECCAIAANISKKGEPNHILVNKIMDYPIGHFITYSVHYVAQEMIKRGYSVDLSKFWKHFSTGEAYDILDKGELFRGWHNYRYLTQCFHNLEEKFDCGGISGEEFSKILNAYEREVYKVV